MPAKSTGGAKKTTKKAAKKSTAKKTTAKKTTAKSAAKKTTKKTAKKTATRTKSAARKPKAAAAPKPAAAKKTAAKRAATTDGTRVRVRQVRSGIGRRADFRRTLRALGIKHHQGEVVVTRNSAIDGMLRKVSHLIRVTPEE